MVHLGNLSALAQALDLEIDRYVYDMFELSDEEIDLIELALSEMSGGTAQPDADNE